MHHISSLLRLHGIPAYEDSVHRAHARYELRALTYEAQAVAQNFQCYFEQQFSLKQYTEEQR